MSSFVQNLSDKTLTSRDENLLNFSEAPKTMLSQSNRLFEMGLREIDEEIKESTEKGLKRANIYRVARIIVNVIGIALICIVPIAIIFNIPIWIPIVVPLIGGLTLSFISGKLRSKEQLIRLRHKSLLFYRQKLLNKELNVRKSWKDRASENEVNKDKVCSNRMELIYKESGIETPKNSKNSILSQRISSLNLESPIFLHRYESGMISGDAQALLKPWRMYQREVLKIKKTFAGQEDKLGDSLLQLKNQAYISSGINLSQLPIQGAVEGLREIKSFCSYGLQIANTLEKSFSQYQMTFPLLSLVANSRLALGFKLEDKLEEISRLRGQIKYYLRKISLVNTEEEALSLIEEVSSINLMSRIRSTIDSSSSLNSSIASKITQHPTNVIIAYKQRLMNLKMELKNPLWASEWFNTSQSSSWKNKLFECCSFSKKAKPNREEVREALLSQIKKTEEKLLSLEKNWGHFLDNDLAKLLLENSLDKFNDFNKSFKDPLDKKTADALFKKMSNLKELFLEEMIGADNESAADKFLEMSKELEVFDTHHLKKLEALVSNHGESFFSIIVSSLTTKNSTFRKREKEIAKKYEESVSAPENLSELASGFQTSRANQLSSFKDLLCQFEKMEDSFSRATIEGNETSLLEATQEIKEICEKLSINEIHLLKNHLAALSKKLQVISKNKTDVRWDDDQLNLEVRSLEKQIQAEKKEIVKVRDRFKSQLNQVLQNIEKQVVGTYVSQLVINMVLSLICFLIISLLGAFLISFNIWWVHLIFLGITLSFVGINLLFSHLIDRQAKKKMKFDLQNDLLISSEVKDSTYPNVDLLRIKELQGSLGLDGVHGIWAQKEIESEDENKSHQFIIGSSREEALKELKSWHKELNKKKIPSFEFVSQQGTQDISELQKLSEFQEIIVKNDCLEKSISSKEKALDCILSEQLLQEQELALLEKTQQKLQTLSLEIEKEKENFVKNGDIINHLKIKHQFLKGILNTKEQELQQKQVVQANKLFNDLLNIYKDESLSPEEKKDKSKPIIKVIYKENLFSLVHDLVHHACAEGFGERDVLNYQDTIQAFQKTGVFWDSELKKSISNKVKYLRSLIESLENIETRANQTANSIEVAEKVQKALFLMEKLPLFLKESELFLSFIPCFKLEEARIVSLELEKEKKEFLQKQITQEAQALVSLKSIFSSLLEKLLLRDSHQIEEASLKLENLISSAMDTSSENIEKEKAVVSIFQQFPLYILKDLEKKILLKLAQKYVERNRYHGKMDQLSCIKEHLSKEKREGLSLEEHGKILIQKKEKEILQKKKIVKEKIQELKILKQKKIEILKKIEESAQKQPSVSSSIVFEEDASQASYDILLGKIILSRKEITRFSVLYKKWKDKDSIHASHMKKMHRRAREEYNDIYQQLVGGICSGSLSIPENLDVQLIKEISKKLEEKQNALIATEKSIEELNVKEEKLLFLQQKIAKKQQELTVVEEKSLESQVPQEQIEAILESLSQLQAEVSFLRKQEETLLNEVKELTSLRVLKQTYLKELNLLREEFISVQ